MKPKNIFQQQVVDASRKLSPITPAQSAWGYQHLFAHIAKRTKKGVVTCLECAHQWNSKEQQKTYVCPHCGTKLKANTTNRRAFKDVKYYGIITKVDTFQVLRFYYVTQNLKAGKNAEYTSLEVVQRWITPAGKYATMARLRPMSWYDNWLWGSELEIRNDKYSYNISPFAIYPKKDIIKEIKRNGFKGCFYDISPFDLFCTLLSSSQGETLFKAKQLSILKHAVYRNLRLDDYWASICICIRNGYIIPDGSMWCDYIDLLNYFGKDVRNSKYVCPIDLKHEHDKYLHKKNMAEEKKKIDEQRSKAIEQEPIFQELKAKFFGIDITDGEIEIKPLESVLEYLEEGTTMHHCVFACEYYSKPDSLVLSAKINGERIETVEFSLSKFKVIQSRGVCNKETPYHKRIILLMNSNVKLIKQRLIA